MGFPTWNKIDPWFLCPNVLLHQVSWIKYSSYRTGLTQGLLNFSMHQNHLQDLLKYRFTLGPTPSFWFRKFKMEPEFTFPTKSQRTLLMLSCQCPHFKYHQIRNRVLYSFFFSPAHLYLKIARNSQIRNQALYFFPANKFFPVLPYLKIALCPSP